MPKGIRGFPKGYIPYNKGGKSWNSGKRGLQVAWNKGIPVSKEHRKHLSEIQKGKHNSPATEIKKGQRISPKTEFNGEMCGSKCHSWKGGITPLNEKERKSIEYKSWRYSVYSRDNWTCQDCGQRGGRLHAHHLRGFSKFPEFRTSIENGITLCKECHTKRHKKTL